MDFAAFKWDFRLPSNGLQAAFKWDFKWNTLPRFLGRLPRVSAGLPNLGYRNPNFSYLVLRGVQTWPGRTPQGELERELYLAQHPALSGGVLFGLCGIHGLPSPATRPGGIYHTTMPRYHEGSGRQLHHETIRRQLHQETIRRQLGDNWETIKP